MANSETRRRKFANEQEEIVHALSARLFGDQALFCPEYYGKNANEPADVVWVANRCAILMYLKAGKKSFDKKRMHNLGQLHRWLKVWQRGEPLVGFSGDTRHEINFGDIDHVIGLSVVGGLERFCQYEPDEVRYSADRKLAACATITALSLIKAAGDGASARDVVAFLAFLQERGERIPEAEFLKFIHDRTRRHARDARKRFRGLWNTTDELNESWFQHLDQIRRMRSYLPSDVMSVLADFTTADVLWLSVAEASLIRACPNPGEYGPLVAMAARSSGAYSINCYVAASIDHMYARMQECKVPTIKHLLKGPGLCLVSMLNFGKSAPWRIIAVAPREGRSMLETETDALRQVVLG